MQTYLGAMTQKSRRRMGSAENKRIEAPSKVGNGEGCPLPNRLGNLGSVMSSLSSGVPEIYLDVQCILKAT